jgi:hypothetical protein
MYAGRFRFSHDVQIPANPINSKDRPGSRHSVATTRPRWQDAGLEIRKDAVPSRNCPAQPPPLTISAPVIAAAALNAGRLRWRFTARVPRPIPFPGPAAVSVHREAISTGFTGITAPLTAALAVTAFVPDDRAPE